MPLHKTIKSFLARSGRGHVDPIGAIIRENANSSLRIGLHSKSEIHRVLRHANLQFAALDPSEQDNDHARQVFTRARYDDPHNGVIHDHIIRRSNPEIPNLSGIRLAHVVFASQLHDLMSDADRKRLNKRGVRLPVGRAGLHPSDADRIQRLPEMERQFNLGDRRAGGLEEIFLGNPLIWFTLATEVGRVRATLSPGQSLADRIRDALGLVERKEGAWLALLEFDGEAVRRHFRPTFCDADGYRRFMVDGDRDSSYGPPGPWGQTADLHAIATGQVGCSGVPERVGHRMNQTDFGGKKLSFELLGQLQVTRGEIGDETDVNFAARLHTANAG